MLRFQLLLVGLLVGALILASLGNSRLKEQVNRANKSLLTANQTEVDLRNCRLGLDEYKLLVTKTEMQKRTLTAKVSQLEMEVDALKLQKNVIETLDKEIAKLKTEIKNSAKREIDLKKRLQEAEKAQGMALDSLAKAEEARRVKEAQEKKNASMAKAEEEGRAREARERKIQAMAKAEEEGRVREAREKRDASMAKAEEEGRAREAQANNDSIGRAEESQKHEEAREKDVIPKPHQKTKLVDEEVKPDRVPQ
ncbi:hypothetical protein GWK47_020183 [Chionoecetes opilio]|uniref:Uncharacterized protein n=1 Tax=Chionoecetes opilio TaxID=41210 RepID=A0A8J4XPX1_CHIOP|nr:hypothetical protein GWK47_020183 [Chionoecetes opilio]